MAGQQVTGLGRRLNSVRKKPSKDGARDVTEVSLFVPRQVGKGITFTKIKNVFLRMGFRKI